MHFTFVLTLGTKELQFNSTTEFNLWKEQEEERTHTFYTKQKEYRPLPESEGIYMYKIIH